MLQLKDHHSGADQCDDLRGEKMPIDAVCENGEHGIFSRIGQTNHRTPKGAA
jgi:hypothetical protein